MKEMPRMFLPLTILIASLLLIGSSAEVDIKQQNKVCYDDIGCFSSVAPFDNALNELPDSPEQVQVQTYLWTKQNPVTPQELLYKDIRGIRLSQFNATRPTKVLIHGYLGNKRTPVIKDLTTAFLKMDDYNLIGVMWFKGSRQFYPKAVANTRVVAAVVVNLLTGLRDNMGMKLSDVHLIGHSLGAHIAGYIGTGLPGIARITGLDPAGPLLANTDPIVRLDPSDALFVDAIHTDAVPFEDAGFGTMEPMGHVDFYPNGGQVQPGCPSSVSTTLKELIHFEFTEAVDSVVCAHDRAVLYFGESIVNTKCQFKALKCESWNHYINNRCDTEVHSVLGINAIKYPGRGQFYLKTNAITPFCRSRLN
ncbi:hypothetical protein ACF0H5_022934 [Mactra antiquata]